MAPKRLGRLRAKAKVRARQVLASNSRRTARHEALKTINSLAEELELPTAALVQRTATAAAVEKLIRVLESRLSLASQLNRLRSAARLWSESGGRLSAPVLPDEQNTPPLVLRHRVLAPTFELKSKAFMLT
jgi:hypothetical protein